MIIDNEHHKLIKRFPLLQPLAKYFTKAIKIDVNQIVKVLLRLINAVVNTETHNIEPARR